MLRLLSRRKASIPLAATLARSGSGSAAAHGARGAAVTEMPSTTEPAAADAGLPSARALSSCKAGSRATILEVRCAHADACRLRALGLCEGAAVSVVNSRDCTLLEVRGSRLAVSTTIAAGIMVMPIG